MKKIGKKLKHGQKRIKGHLTLPSVLSLFFSLLAVILLVACLNAEEIGTNAGNRKGNIVGSVKGVTDGAAKGEEAGKEAGLTADDVAVEIGFVLEESQNLEVLVAEAALHDNFSVGEQYDALYIYKGEVIFSVDLSRATVEENGNGLNITIPHPEVKFDFNEEATEKLFDQQRQFFSGSSTDGYTAYTSSRNELESHLNESMANYDTLYAMAEQAAVREVQLLAGSVAGTGREITVQFAEGE